MPRNGVPRNGVPRNGDAAKHRRLRLAVKRRMGFLFLQPHACNPAGLPGGSFGFSLESIDAPKSAEDQTHHFKRRCRGRNGGRVPFRSRLRAFKRQPRPSTDCSAGFHRVVAKSRTIRRASRRDLCATARPSAFVTFLSCSLPSGLSRRERQLAGLHQDATGRRSEASQCSPSVYPHLRTSPSSSSRWNAAHNQRCTKKKQSVEVVTSPPSGRCRGRNRTLVPFRPQRRSLGFDALTTADLLCSGHFWS